MMNPKLVRERDIVRPHGILPISRSTWHAGVASGRYPQPIKLGPKITAWRLNDIEKLIEQGVEQ